MAVYSSVKIDVQDKKKLDNLAKNAEENLVNYLHLAIDYFHETGVNPKTKFKSFGDELELTKKELAKQIKESRDTYIAFIREMESKRLNVIANNVQDIGNALLDYLKNDAPTKDDLSRLKESLKLSPGLTQPLPEQSHVTIKPLPIPEKPEPDNQASNKRAKQLFAEFLTHGRKNAFGEGFKFDEKIIEHYKQLFNQL